MRLPELVLVATTLLSAGCSAPTAAGAPTPPATVSSSSARSSTAPVPAVPSSGPAAAGSVSIALNSDWLAHGLKVGVSLGGGPVQDMLVDTGSNGVVVSRSYLGTHVEELSPRQTFTGFTYSSSGNSYAGEWVRTDLAFSSVTGGATLARTVPMLVRAVDRMCDKHQVCTSDPSALHVAMLGVGFDRAADRSAAPAHSGPAINPFLNLTRMVAGTMTRGYVVGSGRLVLGPAAADTAGFATVALQRTPAGQPADWQAPTSCVSVAGSVSPQCGSLLLDTGLGYAIIQVPNGVQPPTLPPAPGAVRPTVRAGQRVSITVPSLPAPVYTFTVGAAGAPASVQWGHHLNAGRPFMNISRFALSGTDYLYDAGRGLVGFRPTGA